MYKILISDESEVFCRSLAELLPDEFEPYLCHDGDRLAEYLQTIKPDFLVLDLMLSGTDGLYVLEAANFAGIRPCVVALTTVSSPYIERLLEQMQVSYYLRKPCNMQQLAARITDIAMDHQLQLMPNRAFTNEEKVENFLRYLGFYPHLSGYKMLVSAIDEMLSYDKNIKVLIETKPNEPIDRNVCPTLGHALAVSAASIDPSRVGTLLETAHAVLAGLDPASEMGFALAMGKLWGVHLNDQNGMKFDEDKNFGAENLRSAFNQIKVLKEHNFCSNGEYIGLDVKTMRTQKAEDSFRHIETSLKIAKAMEEKVMRYDYAFASECIAQRNYEALECYVLELIMGIK